MAYFHFMGKYAKDGFFAFAELRDGEQMAEEKVFTLTTRLRMNDEIYGYLTEYITEYNRLYRRMWRILNSPEGGTAEQIKDFYKSENILRRTADTIKWSVMGRKRALYELKKYELGNIDARITKLKEDAEKLKQYINKHKPEVAANKTAPRRLEIYREKKRRLYHKNNKLNILIQHRNNIAKNIEQGTLKLSFGGKDSFNKQYHLADNKFSNHDEWYRHYVRQRDKTIDYIGGAYYICGNDICRMYYNEDRDCFDIDLRKEKFLSSKSDKYIRIENVHFNYLSEYLKEYLIKHQNTPHDGSDKTLRPLSYRIKRNGSKWYLQVMIKISPAEIVTHEKNGVIGVKFTPGLIQTAETDRHGNLTGLREYRLKYCGMGNGADNEIKNVIVEITRNAVSKEKKTA